MNTSRREYESREGEHVNPEVRIPHHPRERTDLQARTLSLRRSCGPYLAGKEHWILETLAPSDAPCARQVMRARP